MLGVDFSGIVACVGKNVTTPAVGAHVSGFVHGGAFPDEGAFSEYTRTPAELVWEVPPNTLSHEQAASVSCGCVASSCWPREVQRDMRECD